MILTYYQPFISKALNPGIFVDKGNRGAKWKGKRAASALAGENLQDVLPAHVSCRIVPESQRSRDPGAVLPRGITTAVLDWPREGFKTGMSTLSLENFNRNSKNSLQIFSPMIFFTTKYGSILNSDLKNQKFALGPIHLHWTFNKVPSQLKKQPHQKN